ncbi:hypothetical protein [Bacillus toyonensis]|uniref:hypothetical protein n=1 Tax=Bacillus toyonensis TaxID=155322 RepID=UPI000BF4F204|nr:hypothetical protein [Bacillus toyonensis]PGF05199.1 hypothetical protein COM61_01905 [Bacillus toyonensis]
MPKRVTVYKDEITKDWTIKDQSTGDTYDLEDVLSEKFADTVWIIDKESESKQEIPVTRVKDFRTVTEHEAVELVIKGHKLYSLPLDSYVKLQESELKNELVWRTLYDEDIKQLGFTLNYDYIMRNQWLVKG